MLYKVGEEVISISHSMSGGGPRTGDKGKVVTVRADLHAKKYLVEFYTKRSGLHDGNDRGGKGKANRCWWCEPSQVLNKKDYLEHELDGSCK